LAANVAAAISGRGDHRDLTVDQIGRQRRQAVDLTLGPAIDRRDVVPLNEASLFEAAVKGAQFVREYLRRGGVKKSNHR
jgi:hypothetical protein